VLDSCFAAVFFVVVPVALLVGGLTAIFTRYIIAVRRRKAIEREILLAKALNEQERKCFYVEFYEPYMRGNV